MGTAKGVFAIESPFAFPSYNHASAKIADASHF
jgi:hypothetical protein